MDGELLPLLHVDLGAPHPRRRGRDGHHGLFGDGPRVQGLHDEEHGHHLGDAGQLQGRVGVGLVQNLPRGLLHEQGRPGVDLRPRRPDGQDPHTQGQAEQGCAEFLHGQDLLVNVGGPTLCRGGAGYADGQELF